MLAGSTVVVSLLALDAIEIALNIMNRTNRICQRTLLELIGMFDGGNISGVFLDRVLVNIQNMILRVVN
ncbi:hypothetical protein SMZ84_000273 [Cronobacter turicensis]|nr:hypothetical protein [Cronobacter turicensis]